MSSSNTSSARRKAAAIASVAACAIAGAAHAQVFQDATYGEADAARGARAYSDNCQSCHGVDLGPGEFAPALKGATFDGHWKGQSAQTLMGFIQTRMPPTAVGSLPPQTYGDITAYILKGNGAKAGASTVAAAAPAAAPAARGQSDGAGGVLHPTLDATGQKIVAARKAKLAALTPVTDAMLAHPADKDWLIWRRTYDVHGFSNLKAIDKANVANLREAWSWSLPQSQNETTPLVHDGVMFVTSANLVEALDARNGDLLWRYTRPLPANQNGGRGGHVKALAIYKDKLFVPTADKHLIALDIHTGALIWDNEVISSGKSGEGVSLDGAPIVARGKVILGASLGISQAKGGCFIVALDADTGKEVWRFNTIARPGQPGGDSWNGAPLDERYGGGVWTAGSYDPVRNLLFFGTGNTYDIGTLLQPKPRKGESNDALYTDSTLAIDPDTGKLVWFYQHMQRDVWDQDWVFEQTLATLPVDGKPRDVVVTAGKLAIFDVMDRATGKYLFSKDMGLQNIVTGIDPKTGKKTTNPAVEPVSGKTMLMCPAAQGARSWPTTALNPTTHILYVPMIESCSDYTWTARSPEAVAGGGIDIQYPARARLDTDGNYGRLEAIDLATHKVLWTLRQRAPIASSVLATAGGVVFNGALDRHFRAYDETTGKVLWETRLNATPSSSPVTYEVDGQQYVAVVSGGGGAFDGGGRGLTPDIDNPNGGTTVVVFKLPNTGARKN